MDKHSWAEAIDDLGVKLIDLSDACPRCKTGACGECDPVLALGQFVREFAAAAAQRFDDEDDAEAVIDQVAAEDEGGGCSLTWAAADAAWGRIGLTNAEASR